MGRACGLGCPNGYCSEDCYENNIAEAMKYFKMAGNYAPAYNNIAQILLKEAEIKLISIIVTNI